MTIATDTNESPLYLTNGATTTFDFDFPINTPSTELIVYELTIATGIEVPLTDDVDYEVTTHNADLTGSITYPKTGGPEPTGKKLRLVREVAETQGTNLKNQNGYRGEQHETVFDKLVMMIQQISSKINRAIKLPVTSSLTELEFPSPVANKMVGWNSDATELENKTPESAITLPLPLSQGGLGSDHDNVAAIRSTLDVDQAGTDNSDPATLLSDTTTTLTVGYDRTSYDQGTKTTGTFTPEPSEGGMQKVVNGGAHTLSPPTEEGEFLLYYTNNGSAGSITTSGFDVELGDSFDTTDTNRFECLITNDGTTSILQITALQ